MFRPKSTQPSEGRRYRQAGEWLVCLRSTTPSESEIRRWLIWCEKDPQNLVAFEELDRDWHDLEGLRAMPELIRAGEHPSAGSRRRDAAPLGPVLWRSAIVAAITITLIMGFWLYNRTAAFDVRREGDHDIVTVEEGTIRVVAPGSQGTLQWQWAFRCWVADCPAVAVLGARHAHLAHSLR